MKKRILRVTIILVTILTIVIIRYNYTNKKSRDINYTVEKYITTGLLNTHKLYKIDNMKVVFSDGNIAVMNVSGLQDKAPHRNVNYKIFLEKKDNGAWKVKKVYSE